MKAETVILLVTAGIAALEAVWMVLLWRQHRTLKRQLIFIRENDSAMRVSVNIEAFGELALSEEINRVLDDVRQQKHAMSEREKLIADAYANLSHDIRTPLTSLDGYVQLLRTAPDEKTKERYTAIIEERIGTLKDLLEDLFTFTKLKNEAYELELEPVSLRSIVSDTVLSYYDVWKNAGIEPEIDIADEAFMMEGNETAVKRILQNSTKNAMVHGHESLRIQLKRENEKTALIVIANKVEHPQEIEIGRVFEQFYTADRYHRQVSSGLGLAIAKELTERMGGTIGATLEGDTFAVEIRLPA